jgi:amino-acid N-acetyltransferase
MTEEAQMRKATVLDVPSIAELINSHAQKGLMLQRPISKIYDYLRDYVVIEDHKGIVACGALHVTWADLAEIRSLAVREDSFLMGNGRRLVEFFLNEAASLRVEKVFALTYKKPFFERMGFVEIDKATLPHKIWNECINCIHFPNCNEVAMIYPHELGSRRNG